MANQRALALSAAICLLMSCAPLARADCAQRAGPLPAPEASSEGQAAQQPAKPPPREAPPELKLYIDVTIVTAVSVEALKRTIKDPRPYGEGHAHGYGYGFPSGDATLAFALATVTSHYHPRQKALWYLLAARVAWSRVKREAHDWDDVMGGAALGTYIGHQAVTHGGIVLTKWEW